MSFYFFNFFYPHPVTFFFSLLLDREGGGGKITDAGEKHWLVAYHRPKQGICARSLSRCPDRESNLHVLVIG